MRFWGPIRTYIHALAWIQLCLLLLLPLALITAVIFAVLSQVVRAFFEARVILNSCFFQANRQKSSSVISRRKSFRDANKDSLFSDAELITDAGFAREMVDASLSLNDGIFHDNVEADEKTQEEQ